MASLLLFHSLRCGMFIYPLTQLNANVSHVFLRGQRVDFSENLGALLRFEVVYRPQVGHEVVPEPPDPAIILFASYRFTQHSLHTLIRPRSLWLAEYRLKSSPLFPQSLQPVNFSIVSNVSTTQSSQHVYPLMKKRNM
jgi:hypothetical protein